MMSNNIKKGSSIINNDDNGNNDNGVVGGTMMATITNGIGSCTPNTATTARLRRGTTTAVTTNIITSTKLLRFLRPSSPITATANAVGISQQKQVQQQASTHKRRRNVFGRNKIFRNRLIGIGIILSMFLYILVQHRMTIDLHMMLLQKNGRQHLPVIMDEKQSSPKQQYRWAVCNPLGSSTTSADECYYHNTTTSTTSTSLRQQTVLLFNNSFFMTRYICQNISVAAYTHILIPSSNLACYDTFPSPSYNNNKLNRPFQQLLPLSASSRLFEFPPLDISTTSSSLSTGTTNDGKQPQQRPISPVKVRFGRRSPKQLFPDCDIPCYHDGEPISDRYVDTINGTWTISYSMEGPQYWESIYIQPQAWRENRFWSTTSYKSEVPLPYYDNVTFHIWHNNYVPYSTGIKGGVFMAFNCDSKNHREQIVKDMISNHFRVDAISSCLHNADPPNGMSNELSDKVSIMKQYLFYLAFENQCEDDYITEKLWGAYDAGTIPIYYGAPNVKDHVPNHSLIHVDDYNTTFELVQHLMAILNDQQLYESYHLWRTQPIPEHFHTKYDFTATHSTCRTCRWAYARMYGTGWDHTSQSLRPLHIGFSRQVCFSSLIQRNNNHVRPISYLVQHPFVEEWYDANGKSLVVEPIVVSDMLLDNNNAECQHPLTDSNNMVDIDNGVLQRTIYNHDGVIDLIIRRGATESSNESLRLQQHVTLRLQFPLLQGPVRSRNIRSGVWHVQNEKSRYTLLFATAFSPAIDTVVTQVTDITYDIVIASPIRIRVIIEDVDTFHEGANDVENFFGKLLADDFFNPIQVSVRIPFD